MDEKKCINIVDNLAKQYAIQNRSKVAQQEGVITNDFIDRGLSGSTIHVAKALNPHVGYINNLINHIIEKLEIDFKNIPLSNFKDALCDLSEQEFRRISNVPSRLIASANLQSVTHLGSQFQRELQLQAEKIRCAILNKCDIAKDVNDAQPLKQRFKTFCDNHPVISFFVCAGGIVLAIFTFMTKLASSIKALLK